MTDSKSTGFQLDQVCFSYNTAPCLSDISMLLEAGHFYGLIGPNGSGKSTLLDLLSAHLRPTSGTITCNDSDLASYPRMQLAKMLSNVPQSFSFNFDYRVYDVVLMGRHPYIARFSSPTQTDYSLTEQALARLDISHLAERSITRLSGGEKQRVLVARALAQNSEFMLLDEVTANLDISHAISIMQTMTEMVKQGKTVIAALHDLNMAMAFCDRVIVLEEGRLRHYGAAAEVITSAMVSDIYQVASEIVRAPEGTGHLHFNYR